MYGCAHAPSIVRAPRLPQGHRQELACLLPQAIRHASRPPRFLVLHASCMRGRPMLVASPASDHQPRRRHTGVRVRWTGCRSQPLQLPSTNRVGRAVGQRKQRTRPSQPRPNGSPISNGVASRPGCLADRKTRLAKAGLGCRCGPQPPMAGFFSPSSGRQMGSVCCGGVRIRQCRGCPVRLHRPRQTLGWMIHSTQPPIRNPADLMMPHPPPPVSICPLQQVLTYMGRRPSAATQPNKVLSWSRANYLLGRRTNQPGGSNVGLAGHAVRCPRGRRLAIFRRAGRAIISLGSCEEAGHLPVAGGPLHLSWRYCAVAPR